MMRRSAKERQDAIDVVQKTLHAGLIDRSTATDSLGDIWKHIYLGPRKPRRIVILFFCAIQILLLTYLIAWAKVCGDAVIWCQAKTSGVCPTKWVNCVTCVGQSPAWRIKPRWSRYHYCHLGGQSCVLSPGLQAGVFPRSAGVCSRRPPCTAVHLTATGMRHHAYTDRERDTAGGGGVATWLQRQSVIGSTVGELIVIKCWLRHAVACNV